MVGPQIVIHRLEGWCPVIGEGTVNGHFFYFYARHDGWSFSISLDPNVSVYGMWSSAGGFYVEGSYGKPGGHEAGYMADDDARTIIHDCAHRFIEEHPEPPTPDYKLLDIPNLTGTWSGVTQGYATPLHTWRIKQQGRFLHIYGTLEDDESGPKPKICWLGQIIPEEQSFLLRTNSGEFKAIINDANTLIVPQWVAEQSEALINYNYGKIDRQTAPTAQRYDAVFSRVSNDE